MNIFSAIEMLREKGKKDPELLAIAEVVQAFSDKHYERTSSLDDPEQDYWNHES